MTVTQFLSMAADASARFLTSTPELTDFAQRLAEVVVRREDSSSHVIYQVSRWPSL